MERIFRKEDGGLNWQNIGVVAVIFIVVIMLIFVMGVPVPRLVQGAPETALESRVVALEHEVEFLKEENRLLRAAVSGKVVLRFDLPEDKGYEVQFPGSGFGALSNNQWLVWDPIDGTYISVSKDDKVLLEGNLAPCLKPGDLIWVREWDHEGEVTIILEVLHMDGTEHYLPCPRG